MCRPLNTRSDVALLLLDWLRPLKNHYSTGAAWLTIGNTAAHYSEASARMEGYSRVLWGLGPLFSRKNSDLPSTAISEVAEWKKIVRRGLINGTNPTHEEYWLDVSDYDQKMVEMAAIVNAVLLAPDTMWEPLTDIQRQNVYKWLNQINSHEVHANNWRFFRILVNMLFIKLGLKHDKKRMEEDWQIIEGCYEGDGWYFDGHAGQKDYYIPFAMHYYGLIYSKYMEKEEPERCRTLKLRAEEFFKDFMYWFDADGREVPYGRSLTYRFAHSAVFSAMAYANVNVPMPELKHMLLGNLRYWCEQPIFDYGGILTIGYQYPNLIMSEHYNAPGSPYWSFKTFLILALPENHEFWSCQEKQPKLDNKKLLKHPNMISVHENGGHTLLYPVGQHSYNFGNTTAKYQKLVYSNIFGFSISRGAELNDGAFDNTIAFSIAGENKWTAKSGEKQYEVNESFIRMIYEPIKGVNVQTIIVPLEKGHVRIHFIKTDIDIELADGGFAIRTEKGVHMMSDDMVHTTHKSVECDFEWGNAGAVSLMGDGEPRLIKAFPNTNIMYGSTVIPTVCHAVKAGACCIADYFYGDAGKISDGIKMPQITTDKDGNITVLYNENVINMLTV